MKLHDLRETRATKITEMRALVSGAETAGRDLNETEAARFSELKSEAENIEARIGRAEALADLERRAAGSPVNSEMAREIRSRYSVARAVQGALSGKLTGLEGEAHAELSKGREVRGVMIPTEALLGVETRDGQTVGTDPAGGYMVATQLGAMADRFRPRLVVEQMGATILRGLTGPFELPNLHESGSSYWVAENEDVTRSAATLSKVALSPRTVGGEYRVSRRLLLRSAESIEAILARDLGLIIAEAVDRAAINGNGVGEPVGVLNANGVEPVVASVLLSDTCADLIAATELANVAPGAFLTNSTVAGLARKVKDKQDRTIPLAEIFHGQPLQISNQVPSTLGNANDKSAIIWGLWSELVLGYWSGIDLLANPFHPDVSSNGGVLLHAFLDVDTVVRHPEAFSYSLV